MNYNNLETSQFTTEDKTDPKTERQIVISKQALIKFIQKIYFSN